MKLHHGLAALALTLTAGAVHADITSTVAVVSDYDFRGITQTAGDPGFSATLDYVHESGFHANAWLGNVDFGDCCGENFELDLIAGYAGGETFPWDIGVVYYTYPGAKGIDFPEVYASLGYKWLQGKISYSNDFGNSGDNGFYYEANANFSLPKGVGLNLHVGRSDGGYWDNVGGGYTDYAVGLGYTVGHFNLGVKYIDGSDFKPGNNTPGDVGSSDSKVVFSVATTFPWTKGEE